jgi:hypothetical protein
MVFIWLGTERALSKPRCSDQNISLGYSLDWFLGELFFLLIFVLT